MDFDQPVKANQKRLYYEYSAAVTCSTSTPSSSTCSPTSPSGSVIRLTLTRLSSQVSEAEFEFPHSIFVFAGYTQQFYVFADYT